jgi:hypothetical protein
LSLPSYTGSALKREQNSCNGYLSLLYFCLNAIELSPRNVICRLSISILYIFLYITKAKFFLVSNFFMNRFPSLSAFNWASRPHQPAIYSLFWVKNLEVAWKSIFFLFTLGSFDTLLYVTWMDKKHVIRNVICMRKMTGIWLFSNFSFMFLNPNNLFQFEF